LEFRLEAVFGAATASRRNSNEDRLKAELQ